MRIKKIFDEFFNNDKSGGLILVFVTIISLILANSPFQSEYINFWNTVLFGHSIVYWINDGLMTIFFLLIGLELEHEIYQGELANIKNASLPIFAALGGMLVPAGIYSLLNFGTVTQSGTGIPMATDIAFAVGILSLLGSRIPNSLKIFLTALAVIDDLGAIIVIAVFYTASLSFLNLFIALGIWCCLLIVNRLKIDTLTPYIIGGIIMWYFMLNSGVHATITGVLLAFAIPFRDGSEKTPSFKLMHFLNKPVAFVILPLFAIANICIPLSSNLLAGLEHTSSLGILAGLVIGKPLGIFLFSLIGVSVGICALPGDLKWKNIFGAGCLGGIGFTMSIFITLLAFDNIELINDAKKTILIASVLSGVMGFVLLRLGVQKKFERD